MPTPITAACNRRYHARHVDGHRPPDSVRLIVLHDAEAPSAEGVARYFTTPQAGGSTHLVVDDASCYRCLENAEIPRAAPGANKHGFHIEQCGFARWSAVVWKSHRQTLKRAAYKTALHCVVFGIPPRFAFARDLKAGRPGVTTHAECTKAFGGDHTDPGPFWPRRYFMRLVRGFYADLTV